MDLPRLSSHRLLPAILLAGLVLRLTLFGLNLYHHRSFFFQDPDRIQTELARGDAPYMNTFGFEVSNIAYSLVCQGEGYASPFGGSTGATGWMAPGTVGLYALSFSLFGCFSPPSIFFAFAVALVLSLFSILLVHRIAETFLESPGLADLSALLFAVLPHDAYLFWVQSHLELNLYTFFLLLEFFLLLKYRQSQTLFDCALLATVSALATLFNPLVLLSSACGFALVLFKARRGKRLAALALFLLIHGLALAPWLLYQRKELGGWTFIKSNALFELYLGNVDKVDGVLTSAVFERYHPSRNAAELKEYRRLGELPYVESKFEEFRRTFSWREFITATLNRFLYYFFLYQPEPYEEPGLKLNLKRMFYFLPGAVLVVYFLARLRRFRAIDRLFYAYITSYALPFMFFAVMKRYAQPILPFVWILLAALLGWAVGLRRSRPAARHREPGYGTEPRARDRQLQFKQN